MAKHDASNNIIETYKAGEDIRVGDNVTISVLPDSGEWRVYPHRPGQPFNGVALTNGQKGELVQVMVRGRLEISRDSITELPSYLAPPPVDPDESEAEE
jgi:hypothetical protein